MKRDEGVTPGRLKMMNNKKRQKGGCSIIFNGFLFPKIIILRLK